MFNTHQSNSSTTLTNKPMEGPNLTSFAIIDLLNLTIYNGYNFRSWMY